VDNTRAEVARKHLVSCATDHSGPSGNARCCRDKSTRNFVALLPIFH